jgi:predicted small metal-binding protein
MKEFWCGAVIPDCQAHFRAETDDEILREVAAHAARDHGLNEVPASVVQRVRELIREAR